MILLMRRDGRLALKALAFAFAISVCCGPTATTPGGEPDDSGQHATPLAVTGISIAQENISLYGLGLWGPYGPGEQGHRCWDDCASHAWLWEQCVAFRTHGHGGLGYGTLGYGGYGLYSGFSGFGLSYHLGYGYGGQGLGVGAFGGYPYYGGTGYPCYAHAYFLGAVGPLVVDPPVALESDPREPGYAGDYGPYTGAIPYPETLFAPYAAAAATGSSTGANPSEPVKTSRPPYLPPVDNGPPPGSR